MKTYPSDTECDCMTNPEINGACFDSVDQVCDEESGTLEEFIEYLARTLLSEPEYPYAVVAFKAEPCSTNGVVLGVCESLPDSAEPSVELSGTYFSTYRSAEGWYETHRFFPLDKLRYYLDLTETDASPLAYVLNPEQFDIVMTPRGGELWKLSDGDTVLVAENGCGVKGDGTIVQPNDIDGECVGYKGYFDVVS